VDGATVQAENNHIIPVCPVIMSVVLIVMEQEYKHAIYARDVATNFAQIVKGHGEVRCSHCVGTGWLTSILHTNLTATPEYSFEYLKTASQEFMRVIKKIGISNISDYGKIKLYDSYRSSDGAFIIRYVCHLPIAEAEVKIRGKKSTWLICGYNACVIDAGGAMDNIMEDVISAMQKSEPSLLRPYADVSSSIADFMSYDVNETILSESIEN
jgi:hypothetical protein